MKTLDRLWLRTQMVEALRSLSDNEIRNPLSRWQAYCEKLPPNASVCLADMFSSDQAACRIDALRRESESSVDLVR